MDKPSLADNLFKPVLDQKTQDDATRKWAQGYVGEFDKQVEAIVANMTDEQRRFIWCSVDELMRWAGVGVDSPTAMRLMFLLVVYGHWQQVIKS